MPEFFNQTVVTTKGAIEFRIEPLWGHSEAMFAVYCVFAGKNHCFHMRKADREAKHFIMDAHNCPYTVKEIESCLSDAIFAYIKEGNK
jgi:hypothetical protein